MELGFREIQQELDQVLEQRDRDFPRRGPANTQRMRKLLTRLVEVLWSGMGEGWQPDRSLVEKGRLVGLNPIFVCGYLKSGTTLLVELLDGHPGLIVMPGDSHMVRLVRKDGGLSEELRRRQWESHWISRLVNPKGQKPFWILGAREAPYLNFLRYYRFWFDAVDACPVCSFTSAVLAYYCANLSRPSDPMFWVAKTPRNERFVDTILEWFPSAKFVHVLRDPVTNLSSMKRLCKVRGWRWQVLRTAMSIRKSAKMGYTHQAALGQSRYHMLRYEEMVTQSKKSMVRLSQFLGLCYDDVMLKPTINYLPARANSMYKNRQVYGEIRSNVNDRRFRGLSPVEACIAFLIFYARDS